MEISIESVVRIRLSAIEEYADEDEEDDDEPFFRTLVIETDSGMLEIELAAASRQALEPVIEL